MNFDLTQLKEPSVTIKIGFSISTWNSFLTDVKDSKYSQHEFDFLGSGLTFPHKCKSPFEQNLSILFIVSLVSHNSKQQQKKSLPFFQILNQLISDIFREKSHILQVIICSLIEDTLLFIKFSSYFFHIIKFFSTTKIIAI